MKRLLVCLLGLALASCSPGSSPQKSPTGGESLLPVAAGTEALGGALTIAEVNREADGRGVEVVLRASSGAIDAFVLPRWFGDASLKREYRAFDEWIPVHVDAGAETRLRLARPYPFAPTLGLDVSAKKPAGPTGEGKALPGRIVVTPEQEKKLVLYRYKGLRLTQYESRKPGAPKLAVWRDSKGKVVAAVEIYVRSDAKTAAGGIRFVHTNGEKTIGTSLAYAATKNGAPSKDAWDFVIFEQGGREVAVPWRPLVKNASFLGMCDIGSAGLDASLLGAAAKIGSIAAKGFERLDVPTDDFLGPENVIEHLESAPLEGACWSMANPTRGSRETGAPVVSEYSGTQEQLWEIFISDDMTFTPSAGAGGGKYGRGIHPAGAGTVNLGTLHAVRSGQHYFNYARTTLEQDPASAERLMTSDGPVCPGEAPSDSTGILSDPANPCTSDVPGCTERPVGDLSELVVPCASGGGTTICEIDQKGQPPGYVSIAADGDAKGKDLEFDGTPIDEEELPLVYDEIGGPGEKEPEKPLTPVTITVAHTPGLGDVDLDDATFNKLVEYGKQFGYDFKIVREPGKSLFKPSNGSGVATDIADDPKRTDQYNFSNLVAENLPNKVAQKPYDIVLIFTEYVKASGFRIGFDFGSGIAIAAGTENRDTLTPDNAQAGYYRKANAEVRAKLLFHEILHHVTGGNDVHEDKGIMSKYNEKAPNPSLTVGPTMAQDIADHGGKSVAELKAAGLVDESTAQVKDK